MTVKPIRVPTKTESYEIAFGVLEDLPRHLANIGLPPGRCVVITDEIVAALYLDTVRGTLLEALWNPVTIDVPPGETSKSSTELSRLYDLCLDHGIDRRTPIIALGGGVVGDLAGYCAATILRGVPLVQMPTTLVAQVDSSIGGKTGINHARGKNLIGAFFQPRLVYTDVRCLLTLPEREWHAGLAEVVKHALIDSPELICETSDHWDELLKRDLSALEHHIPRSARVKVGIVSQDVHEQGIRAFLNLGHTVGHAIENVAGYGRLLHGEAVAVGLAVALQLSEQRNPQSDFSLAWDLVDRLPKQHVGDIAFERIAHAMDADKKNVGGIRQFVLLSHPGEAMIARDVTAAEIEDAWNRVLAK